MRNRILGNIILFLFIMVVLSNVIFASDSMVSYRDYSYSDKVIVIENVAQVDINSEDDGSETTVNEEETVITYTEYSFQDIFTADEETAYSTENSLFTLTNPDFTTEYLEDIIYTEDDIFTIRGIANETDILVSLFVYDQIFKRYIPAYNQDGINTWLIEEDSYGLFTSGILDLNQDKNKFKLVVYRNTDETTLNYGEDVQVNYFTINRIEILDEEIEDFFKDWLDDLFSTSFLNTSIE
jgi:hypothetical protein